MTDTELLTRECIVFSSYLGSETRREHTIERYIRAHDNLPNGVDAFDFALVAFARGGAWRCSLADAYARRARPYGLLRRKLTLSLALLESGRDTHVHYDQAVAAPLAATLTALVFAGTWWVLRTLVAVVIVGPLHMASIVASGGKDG